MPDDSSLADFFEGESDADDEAASSGGEPDADSQANEDPTAASDGVDAAATVTYEWSDDGVACADCGEPTRRRWRDDGTFVCADCKDW
ncbi:DUF7573 domain-containing protein [Natronoarchaeum rubrum]|uniref:DUF7573 domain-containing protein n=1 Tax=Natronoarchaeum rubrum TaxID=755311 RepID=UPI002111EBFB|nr:hypothetical protein [Natronoarchaeum rubrum]